MPPTVMTVNGEDLAEYGLWLNPPSGLLDAPIREDNLVRIPGLAGGLILHEEGNINSRELVVQGIIYGQSEQDVHDLWENVKRRLSGPVLEVEFAAWPGRKALCRYQSMDWLAVPGLVDGAGVRLRFLMPNPYLTALEPDIYVAVNGEPVYLELGTAPSDLQLHLIGIGAADPEVQYHNAQGLLAGLAAYITPSLPITSWIHFDGRTFMSHLYTAPGVAPENAGALWVADSRIFHADPLDGDAAGGPSLTPVNCNLVAYVRKNWL